MEVVETDARRQFDACEPENRLVARTLERDWEQRLAAGLGLHHIGDEVGRDVAGVGERDGLPQRAGGGVGLARNGVVAVGEPLIEHLGRHDKVVVSEIKDKDGIYGSIKDFLSAGR